MNVSVAILNSLLPYYDNTSLWYGECIDCIAYKIKTKTKKGQYHCCMLQNPIYGNLLSVTDGDILSH